MLTKVFMSAFSTYIDMAKVSPYLYKTFRKEKT